MEQPKTPGKGTDKTPRKRPAQVEEPPCPLIMRRANTLWVKSTERGGGGPLHLVENADWRVPLARWTSACGWAFARHSVHVAFATKPGFSTPKCRKCSTMLKLRDDVKEGVKSAQLMATDVEQLMQAGGTKTPMKKRSRMDMLQTPPRWKRRLGWRAGLVQRNETVVKVCLQIAWRCSDLI